MKPSALQVIVLFNCRACDDIQAALEEAPRTCFCGKSACRFDVKLGEFRVSGQARLFEIDIEEYDRAAPGEDRKWRVRE
jgi:hypothetical protein